MSLADCPLCFPGAEDVLWHSPQCRVILAHDLDYPSFCRVIWQAHVAEMTDLGVAERDYFMQIVWTVEQTLRALLQPKKMNLASLGNQVPHLHWHIIPRFADDTHFPDPIWAPKRRVGTKKAVEAGLIKTHLVTNLRDRLNNNN